MKTRLQQSINLLIAFLLITSINSCEKFDPLFSNGIFVQQTNVKTFEIISVIASSNLEDKYNGTFGSKAITLLKTSDTTLTFFVPDIDEGEAILKFELANILFNVTKTTTISTTEFIANIKQNIDAQIELVKPSTPEEKAEVDNLILYQQEVISLFNTLTEDEKRQTSLFYEANKETFKSFASTSFTRLDASTKRNQSFCPRTDFKSFYDCTAGNLGVAAIELKNTSSEFIQILALAGASAYLAPASFGLSAFGTTLALGTAGYLLVTEVKPAFIHFKYALYPFLEANWIFTSALAEASSNVFKSTFSFSFNLKPKFSSISSSDEKLFKSGGYFIRAMNSLRVSWDKLSALFGSFPSYKNTTETTTLSTSDISITNISNPNVQFHGNSGQSVAFKTLTGNEESFTYYLTVSKEGFSETKQLNGKVMVSMNDTISRIKAMLENKVWNQGKDPWVASDQSETKIIFNDCCYGGSNSDYYWEFTYDSDLNKIYVDGVSGFNGYTQNFELHSISPTAFSLICIPGSNCTPGVISYFPR